MKSQFLEPDGRFPNHVPNPEDPEAMDSICGAVIREKAPLVHNITNYVVMKTTAKALLASSLPLDAPPILW